MTGDDLPAFRLGDVRGVYPDEIDESFVTRFAHAFAGHFKLTGKVATGRDMRDSSEGLQRALNDTFAAIGLDVIDIGLCPTELGYFASGEPGVETAIVVTASHNPAKYNGLKCVLRNGAAISFDSGLRDVMALMQSGYRHGQATGSITRIDYHARYLQFLRAHFPPDALSDVNIALNGLNGTAATMAAEVADAFELPATWFRRNPGPIPEQGADPANPTLAREMKRFMQGGNFGLGVAWDGDCDRCVCFDGDGELLPTYYMVGLLAEWHLRASPGAAIVFDTRLCWNTLDVIRRGGGKAAPAKTGHAFMKQRMHETGAVYGGELSSHHYFGKFLGCDSGMFAWLSVLQIVRGSNAPLHELIARHKAAVRCTPEINVALGDIDAAFAKLTQVYGDRAIEVDRFDGMSFTMPGEWRFSVRRSKTEPVVRLNFEARADGDALLGEAASALEQLESFRADDTDWTANLTIQ